MQFLYTQKPYLVGAPLRYSVKIMPVRRPKTPTSFRLTARALGLVEKLAVRAGIGRSTCLEVAIRELAKREDPCTCLIVTSISGCETVAASCRRETNHEPGRQRFYTDDRME